MQGRVGGPRLYRGIKSDGGKVPREEGSDRLKTDWKKKMFFPPIKIKLSVSLR